MQKINLFLPFVLIFTFSVSTLANNDTIPEKNKSLEIHASYTGDILTNVVGGIQQKTAYLGMLNL